MHNKTWNNRRFLAIFCRSNVDNRAQLSATIIIIGHDVENAENNSLIEERSQIKLPITKCCRLRNVTILGKRHNLIRLYSYSLGVHVKSD